MKELQSINLRSPKVEVDKPFLNNRDMCGFMCIICAALITSLMFTQVVYYSKWQFYGTIVSFIFFIFLALFWTTQKIVRFCNRRAKRKAQDNKVKDLNKNTIK